MVNDDTGVLKLKNNNATRNTLLEKGEENPPHSICHGEKTPLKTIISGNEG